MEVATKQERDQQTDIQIEEDKIDQSHQCELQIQIEDTPQQTEIRQDREYVGIELQTATVMEHQNIQT